MPAILTIIYLMLGHLVFKAIDTLSYIPGSRTITIPYKLNPESFRLITQGHQSESYLKGPNILNFTFFTKLTVIYYVA